MNVLVASSEDGQRLGVDQEVYPGHEAFGVGGQGEADEVMVVWDGFLDCAGCLVVGHVVCTHVVNLLVIVVVETDVSICSIFAIVLLVHNLNILYTLVVNFSAMISISFFSNETRLAVFETNLKSKSFA